MKLWLLKPREYLWDNKEGRDAKTGQLIMDIPNPWDPWYDKAFGFVVRAETEKEARQFIGKEAGDETRNGSPGGGERPDVWTNPKFSSCVELTAEGDKGIIIRDFASA